MFGHIWLRFEFGLTVMVCFTASQKMNCLTWDSWDSTVRDMTRASPTEIDVLDARPSLFISAEGGAYLIFFPLFVSCIRSETFNCMTQPVGRCVPPFFLASFPLLPHVHHRPDAVALLHDVESLVDASEILAVRDELVHLQLAVEVVAHESGQLRATLDATERAALPHTAGDELECCRR